MAGLRASQVKQNDILNAWTMKKHTEKNRHYMYTARQALPAIRCSRPAPIRTILTASHYSQQGMRAAIRRL